MNFSWFLLKEDIQFMGFCIYLLEGHAIIMFRMKGKQNCLTCPSHPAQVVCMEHQYLNCFKMAVCYQSGFCWWNRYFLPTKIHSESWAGGRTLKNNLRNGDFDGEEMTDMYYFIKFLQNVRFKAQFSSLRRKEA